MARGNIVMLEASTADESTSNDAAENYFSTRIPAGRYVVGFVRAHPRKRYGRELFDCEFRIISDEDGDPTFSGQPVVRIVNKIRAGSRPALRSTMAMDFRHVIELLPPKHLHRIRPDEIYAGCLLLVVIADVETDEYRNAIAEGARYSIIRQILRRLEGTPPYLRRRHTFLET